ncbi:glycoside hydrolase [Ascodesmis nigricans]|uniref:glucan 1,3-beta-glucosidase n=1 Tax=Ascodesmis nigricans TaxID=341454 RepID=A0A4S2MS67_9PEZI|nr:glycoside hydrolase [Ascodesmis nigricans]
MGLFDDWDDSAQANKNVPPLNKPFPYGEKPIRGVNLGGWLLIEPFITPSFFKEFSYGDAVIDEYTLSKKYGINRAKTDIEKHYATWVTEKTLKEIRDAGLDHVRMPFGYWAVMEITGDPYVFRTSWRYLLRAIEWARKYGLRVKIDLHSVPGGANGWNHSGRQNVMNWLIGPDGQKNGEKTLEIHTMMARFFAQPRYRNVVTMYGLVNEPRMDQLEAQDVIDWSEKAHEVIRDQGYEGKIVFGDGFRGLVSWKGEFRGYDGMVLDVHQYTIFNGAQISLTHTEKINFVCKTWAADLTASSDAVNGFGPTIVGEWGNADTDCTPYLNNVGQGTRWEGTLRDEQTRQPFGSGPLCPAKTGCSCEKANSAPEDYAPVYRKFLLMFAEAQMDAFENSWGWMYWTWDTEESTQWSYKKGMKAGIVPKVAYERQFRCGDTVPEFEKEGLPGTY